ncbi:hypothetical protein M011DRAFT_386132, partial [Sporormia fimetaria CBS 119925]
SPARKQPTTTTTLPTTPNIQEVVFGNLLIRPWYPSFYPDTLTSHTAERHTTERRHSERRPAELRSIERLYVCQWCFKYCKELIPFLGHARVCERRVAGCPPGAEVYRRGDVSLWEIDGERDKLYAQNLSLFAKLFLDTKSVFYDVTTFLYYLLISHAPSPAVNTPTSPSPASETTPEPRISQVIGFFSKEKMSWDNNNLACILVFPPWQKQGFGQVLMGASYELSKREGRLGGPEKPLSELGHKAYTHYWSQTLARVILSPKLSHNKPITVMDLRNETYIVPEDIIATLQSMDVLEERADGKDGGKKMVLNKAAVREWVSKHSGAKLGPPPVDPKAFLMVSEE